jgi:choline dehydrogenase-like flavoprotein
MLGGSGSHNGMVQNRGSPIDYDLYAKLLNDDSWSYRSVLRYFKRQENYVGVLFNTSNAGNTVSYLLINENFIC